MSSTITTAIVYREEQIEIATDTGEKMSVAGFVAEGTGLGYYIDKAPGNASGSIFEIATGRAYQDFYVLVHLSSGYQFPWYAATEQRMRRWIARIVPLIDWTLPYEKLTILPGWDEALTAKVQAALKETAEGK